MVFVFWFFIFILFEDNEKIKVSFFLHSFFFRNPTKKGDDELGVQRGGREAIEAAVKRAAVQGLLLLRRRRKMRRAGRGEREREREISKL